MPRTPVTPARAIATAAELADEAGFAAISATAVAQRLGIRTPSLYAHVRDLEALLDGVTAVAFEELADRIARAIAGRSGGAALLGFATAQRDYALQHPGRWQATQRPPAEGSEIALAAAPLVELTFAVLRGYDIPERDQVHAVRLLGATINGFLALERTGAFAHREPGTADSWPRILEVLDSALTSWSDAERELP